MQSSENTKSAYHMVCLLFVWGNSVWRDLQSSGIISHFSLFLARHFLISTRSSENSDSPIPSLEFTSLQKNRYHENSSNGLSANVSENNLLYTMGFLINTLEKRFRENMHRHANLNWDAIVKKLETSDKLSSLEAMESS